MMSRGRVRQFDAPALADCYLLGALSMKHLRYCFLTILLTCLAITSAPLRAQTETPGFYASVYAQTSRLGSTTFDEFGSAGLGSGLRADFDGGLGFGGVVPAAVRLDSDFLLEPVRPVFRLVFFISNPWWSEAAHVQLPMAHFDEKG